MKTGPIVLCTPKPYSEVTCLGAPSRLMFLGPNKRDASHRLIPTYAQTRAPVLLLLTIPLYSLPENQNSCPLLERITQDIPIKMAEEQMMEDQMGDDPGMAAGAPTPLTALEVITKRPAMRKKICL